MFLSRLVDDLNKNYKKLSEELNKQQTQYITILSIFVSIVLTFVGDWRFLLLFYQILTKRTPIVWFLLWLL
ncbi:hypothetical protein Kyoto68B_03150 [Helicobacter pylori]